MKILRAVIVKFETKPDKCSVITDLPSPFPMQDPLDTLWLQFTCAQGTGLDYITRNFDIDGEIEVVEVPKHIYNFSGKIEE